MISDAYRGICERSTPIAANCSSVMLDNAKATRPVAWRRKARFRYDLTA